VTGDSRGPEGEMDVEVLRAGPADRATVENLYPLYLHDLSEFSDALEVDGCGRFSAPGDLDAWWEREALFPHLIRAGGKVAGFGLVCTRPHVSPGRDYRMNDFFVLRQWRRAGIGRRAAVALFNAFPGKWEVGWIPANRPAGAFWRSLVAEHTGGCFEQALVMESREHGLPGLHFSTVEVDADAGHCVLRGDGDERPKFAAAGDRGER
jgi:aminoglycoside 6'-N-acetyltransferase I